MVQIAVFWYNEGIFCSLTQGLIPTFGFTLRLALITFGLAQGYLQLWVRYSLGSNCLHSDW